MHFQQQLSKQLLLIKNKKLFYVITAFTQNVTKKTFDVLNLKSQFSHRNTTQLFDQDLSLYVFQCDYNQITSKNKQQTLCFSQLHQHDKAEVGDELGIVIKSFNDSLYISNLNKQLEDTDIVKQAYDYADNIQFYKNGKVYSQQQYLNIEGSLHNEDANEKQKSDSFDLHDSFSYSKKNIFYNGTDELYEDYQNYLYVLKDDYSYKLYIENDYITDINDFLLDGQLSKDIIFQSCQQGNVYIKIYDSNNNIIKKIKLKKTTLFQLDINNISFDENKMSFSSDKQYIQGRNIYHGNSICQTVYCNFCDKNNIFYNDIKYKLISYSNIKFKNGFWFHGSGYIILRLFFNKLVYIKNIFPQFSLKNNDYKIVYRASMDQKILHLIPYKQHVSNGFYCNVVDVKITNNSDIYCQLQRLKIQLYDLQKQDIVKTDRFVFDQSNKIFLNKRNIIDNTTSQYFGKSAIQQYPNYVTGYDINSYFQLSNINLTSNTDYIQVNNQEQIGELKFGLTKAALSGVIGASSNNFRYVYLQYQIVPKKSTSYFDFANFQLFDVSKNYPKKLTLDYIVNADSTSVQLQFQHKNSDSIIIRDTKTNKPIQFIQKWNCKTVNYSSSYFYISRKYNGKDDQMQTSVWNNVVYLRIIKNEVSLVDNSIIIDKNNNILSFMNNKNSDGFVLTLSGNVYLFKKSITKQPQISIHTNQIGQQIWENVGQNQINVISDNKTKRNLKISIQDGQDKHVRLYTVVLQNHPKQTNEFYKNSSVFDLTGNNITNKPNNNTKYIQNNFYNLMYCLNYFYQSEKSGLIFQSNQTYFEKSKYTQYNKSNLHIQWQYNQLFQYLILFDRFDNEKGNDINKYANYFLPFNKYWTEKKSDIQYYTQYYEQENTAQIIFQYKFKKAQIVLSLQPSAKDIPSINVKYDYYYSYSNDYENWTQYKYYTYQKAFYAKYVRIKCCVHAKDSKYFEYAKDCKLKYVDSDVYYLTDKNYFESSYKTAFEKDTKYMVMIRKLYNGQSLDTTLKLFHIVDFELLQPIQKLYVDDKQYIDHNLVISGVDNICKLSFLINTTPKELHILLYQISNQQTQLIKQINTTQFNIQSNNIYSVNCQLPIKNNQESKIFGFKIRYFDNNYQVSQYSNLAKFKFNSIPTSPLKLDVDGE